MLKKVMALIIAIALVLPFNAKAKAVYEFTDIKNIASGVTITNVKRLDGAGWQNINIVEADLSNPYVQTRILTSSNGLNTLETVKKLAEENDTVAAVNGDFFAWNSSDSSKGSAVGTIMNDGELLSSSSETEGMFTFAIDEFNNIICENLVTDITLTAANGNVLKIKHLNKYDSLAEPVIYTSAFGGVTGGSYNNVLEVVIVDGIVTEMRSEQDGVEIPENGYVIRHLPEFDPFLIENLAIGDNVEIKFNANFDLTNYKTMTGGGTMLVTQGQPAKITHNVSGANPRTAIACDETRTKLYLITVDGRQDSAKGYTLNQFTDYLIEIGMYDAMNLDGGGSTTMVTKQNDAQVLANVPSGGSQRKVATAVGIMSDAPKGSVLAGFDVDVAEDAVFAGTTRTFNIKNMIDEYENPYNGKLPEIQWRIENGYGYFENNVLYAEKPGDNVKVYASYGNFTAEKEIDILGRISELIVYPSHFSAKDYNNPQFSVTARDSKGVQATIEQTDINVYNKSSNTKSVEVLNASKDITFSDIVFDVKKDKYSLSKYPAETVASLSVNTENVMSKNGSIKLNYDFSNVPNDTTGAAYLKFDKPVKVSGIKHMGVWVYSPTALNQWLRAEFVDKTGDVLRQTLSENIDFSGWKYITFEVPEGAETMTQLYVVQNSLKEKSAGYVLFDSLSSGKNTFEDSVVNIKASEIKSGDVTFSVIGNLPDSKTLLTKILVANISAKLKKNTNDYIFSLKDYDLPDTDEKTVNSYSSFKKEKSLFITLNNSGGYTSSAQWVNFDNDTSGSFENLFIFLNEDPKLIENKYELIMFNEKLEQLSKKANVYVFYPDMHTNMYYKSGACFVSVGGLNTKSPKSAIALMKKTLIPRIAITGNKVDISFVYLQ